MNAQATTALTTVYVVFGGTTDCNGSLDKGRKVRLGVYATKDEAQQAAQGVVDSPGGALRGPVVETPAVVVDGKTYLLAEAAPVEVR